MPPTVGYLAPPAIPSLGDCFPYCSVDIGKYLLYSSALSQRARWRTSLVISLGGAGVCCCCLRKITTTFGGGLPKEKKTRIQWYIYARRDTEDGPLEIISPAKLLWFRFYVRNLYINKDTKLQKAFWRCFRLPYQQYLELVEKVKSSELFHRWCGVNSKKRSPWWSCFFLEHSNILVVGGHLMIARSQLRLIRMSIVVFSRSLSKMGDNSCSFVGGPVEHERVWLVWFSRMCWFVWLYTHRVRMLWVPPKKQSSRCKKFSNHQNIQLDMQSPSLHIAYNKRRAGTMEWSIYGKIGYICILVRLSENLDARNYDSSGLGPGLDVIGETRTIFTQEPREDAGYDV